MLTVTACKISLLCLYRRIFFTHRFQQVTLAMGVTTMLWWLVATMGAFVPCVPVRKFWDRLETGTCYNSNLFLLTMGTMDIVLDTITLTLPIRPVVGLKMTKSRKVSICGIFLVGGL